MITKAKIAIIVAAAALSLASPAFAQSFDMDSGTGNELSSHYEDNGQLVRGAGATGAGQQVTVRQSGLDAFGMVGQSVSAGESNESAAATGGGSVGYNEEMLIDGSAATRW